MIIPHEIIPYEPVIIPNTKGDYHVFIGESRTLYLCKGKSKSDHLPWESVMIIGNVAFYIKKIPKDLIKKAQDLIESGYYERIILAQKMK